MEYLVNYFASGFVSTVYQWLIRDDCTPERIAGVQLRLYLHILRQHVFLTLRLDNGDSLVVNEKQVVAFLVALHQRFFYGGCASRDILVP
jgi:hypothetical protein